MATLSIQDATDAAEIDQFWAIRGKAIQAYATLEQSFAWLLSTLADTTQLSAETILFKISNADARNKILARLFRQKFTDEYKEFRKALFAQLRPIDLERNEIVHWNAACEMWSDGDKGQSRVVLVPAAMSGNSEHIKKTKEAILAFDRKCNFYAALIFQFTHFVQKKTRPEAASSPWQDIFSQPITYPPPSTHPLFRNPEAPVSHIQAFVVVDPPAGS